ncbi:hypothetical protein DAPPUDRAFT_244784 [Daphnia pulex]|uniref:Focal AT domain-containing protein n=1 Tax=Daphnia pulex TaxID=6669 RepID=E9GLU6_DAPPU|nr:hypothetical protein DAPPUDRAFT_244784 [Daphnia pulex]|eukprot:EFX79570.1 hypothetical protein DAPPUDRAFT_244784 [Daphnia pulex]
MDKTFLHPNLLGYRPLTSALVEVPASPYLLHPRSNRFPDQHLVVPNSEVLAQLIRDSETRADAGHYTAPASAFNRFTVEFSHTSSSNSNPASPQHKSKVKGSKNQPVYANIMMADVTSPSAAAAIETNPAPYKDVRISACRVEQQHTPPHLQRKRLSVAASSSDRSDTDSMDGANASTPLQGNQDQDGRSVIVKKLEPTPTARLDRTHDKVYDATSVVRAAMLLFQGVEMAHKVLSKDMAELVSALKLDERCSNTTLDNEYRKLILKLADLETTLPTTSI